MGGRSRTKKRKKNGKLCVSVLKNWTVLSKSFVMKKVLECKKIDENKIK